MEDNLPLWRHYVGEDGPKRIFRRTMVFGLSGAIVLGCTAVVTQGNVLVSMLKAGWRLSYSSIFGFSTLEVLEYQKRGNRTINTAVGGFLQGAGMSAFDQNKIRGNRFIVYGVAGAAAWVSARTAYSIFLQYNTTRLARNQALEHGLHVKSFRERMPRWMPLSKQVDSNLLALRERNERLEAELQLISHALYYYYHQHPEQKSSEESSLGEQDVTPDARAASSDREDQS
ncbi:hypothetical protein NDN08_001398 [Rhodosorus marinus]|uniref:Mitochondrial import inner membrane translocase subunit TIM22 n=1 Tax=Rhodosorus marinus TaxID=101924 RepID=A0AAV8US64_9RHOD|nr:hypothetical protein NDN08_001398 [Rhodosorus marinus]